MKSPTFLEGAAVALAFSVAGGAVFAALALIFPGGLLLRPLIAGIGLIYVIYLLIRSRERVGRVTALAVWMLAAGLAWLLEPPLLLYVIVHVSLLWLMRCLYYYASLVSAAADLALNGLALAAAVWASVTTGGVFAGIWCFFLVQALFVFIPRKLRRGPGRDPSGAREDDRFEQAHRAAQAAVRSLGPAR